MHSPAKSEKSVEALEANANDKGYEEHPENGDEAAWFFLFSKLFSGEKRLIFVSVTIDAFPKFVFCCPSDLEEESCTGDEPNARQTAAECMEVVDTGQNKL